MQKQVVALCCIPLAGCYGLYREYPTPPPAKEVRVVEVRDSAPSLVLDAGAVTHSGSMEALTAAGQPAAADAPSAPAPAMAGNTTTVPAMAGSEAKPMASVTGGSAGDCGCAGSGGSTASHSVPNRMFPRVVTEGLQSPWEITWGRDNFLWVTERTGFRVTRVDPVSGARQTALQLDDAYQDADHDGLLGIALDPGLLRGANYVYLAYTYNAASSGLDRRVKLARYTFNVESGKLGGAKVLLEGLPASPRNNAGRLKYGPDGKLYYAIGDQGANEYERYCQLNRALALPKSPDDFDAYQGKILRLNPDGSIPDDNPLWSGVRSHVFSYGHRSPNGLAFSSQKRLYSAEQGPKTDDEINLIVSGGNYGWPWLAGYQDNRGYVYREWNMATVPCETLTYSPYYAPSQVPSQDESVWMNPGAVDPLITLYTVDNGYQFQDPACEGADFLCWPALGVSSLEVYEGPLWQGLSLLVTSAKLGTIYRFGLSSDGKKVTSSATLDETKTGNRYRALLVSPDKQALFVATDSMGVLKGPSGVSSVLANQGAILEFRYAEPTAE